MVLKKLKSNKGASILIALLLFLICAAVGSIVLAAATSASGRVSGLEESDRRYYAVTSAAEMFHSMLSDQELSVTRRSEQEQKYTWYDSDPRGTPRPEPVRYAFQINGAPIGGSNESILTSATLDYVLGVNRATAENSAKLSHQPGDGFAGTKEFTVTPYSEDLTLNAKLKVTVVNVTVKAQNGVLLFTFENDFTDTPAASKDQKFKLGFTLTPSCTYQKDPQTWTDTGEKTVTVEQRLDGENNPALDDAGNPLTRTKYTQTDTEITDTSVTVKWTASPITRQGGAA